MSNSSNGKKGAINRFSLFNKSKSSSAQNTESSASNSLAFNDQSNNLTAAQAEDVDSILKKYQVKSIAQPVQTKSQAPVTETQLVDLTAAESLSKNISDNSLQSQSILLEPISLEQSKAFLDAKKKLRLVLSWPDSMSYNYAPNNYLK